MPNVIRGDWAQTFDSLERYTLRVSSSWRTAPTHRPAPQRPGLTGPAEPAALLEFQRWLERHDCYVFTQRFPLAVSTDPGQRAGYLRLADPQHWIHKPALICYHSGAPHIEGSVSTCRLIQGVRSHSRAGAVIRDNLGAALSTSRHLPANRSPLQLDWSRSRLRI